MPHHQQVYQTDPEKYDDSCPVRQFNDKQKDGDDINTHDDFEKPVLHIRMYGECDYLIE